MDQRRDPQPDRALQGDRDPRGRRRGHGPRLQARAGKNQLEEAQKIYWIQQAIFEAILKATGGNAEVLTEPQFSREKPVDGQIYQTTRARIELSCSFRDLPKIVRKLLAQPICIRVSDLELTKAPFQINNTELRLNVDGMGSTFTDDYYSSELDDASLFPGEAKLEEILPEPAVKLTLSLEVFDFEPPAPEPAEDEGAGEDASDEGEE